MSFPDVIDCRCRRESNCYDPFMDLSLPIPAGGGGKGSVLGRVRNVAGGGGGGSCSIDDCLAQFCEDEVLEGDDSYYCSKCKNHEVNSAFVTISLAQHRI